MKIFKDCPNILLLNGLYKEIQGVTYTFSIWLVSIINTLLLNYEVDVIGNYINDWIF